MKTKQEDGIEWTLNEIIECENEINYSQVINQKQSDSFYDEYLDVLGCIVLFDTGDIFRHQISSLSYFVDDIQLLKAYSDWNTKQINRGRESILLVSMLEVYNKVKNY